MQQIISTKEAEKGFYPTPQKIVEKMIEGVDWSLIETVLEPSAGKGDIVRVLSRENSKRYNNKIDIDCIEIDPNLRAILKYNFSEERKWKKREEIELASPNYFKMAKTSLNSEEIEKGRTAELKYEEIRREIDGANVRIIHDNFLTFRAHSKYDLIVMNPPFADGDKHLLKALEIQKNGGSIICLLNAETLKNPFSNSRKTLNNELKNLGASIEYISEAFSGAERRTDVEIALVKIHIPCGYGKSTIFERMQKSVEQELQEVESFEIVSSDFIEQAIQMYNVEIASGLELIREFNAYKPYMCRKIDSLDSWDKSPILSLRLDGDNAYTNLTINRYLERVRYKYWYELFNNPKFVGKLTSKLQEKYRNMVNDMKHYEFTAFNIKQVQTELNSEMIQGVEDTIIELFEKLTQTHSWYPECEKQIHYYSGWASNKAHKIGKKSIIPTRGAFSTRWNGTIEFNENNAFSTILDIEKALNYLSGEKSDEIHLKSVLNTAKNERNFRNIECKYFKIDLYKKGTMHIKYTNSELIDKLNIYASRKKNWLPPNYGKTQYNNMTEAEKEVVAAFHENDTKSYEKILENTAYYLQDPTQNMIMLES